MFSSLNFATAVLSILSNGIILALILAKTSASIRQIGLPYNRGAQLFVLIQKDGTLQFIAILIIYIVNSVGLKYPTVQMRTLPLLLEAVTATLISRFNLNLRAIYTRDVSISGRQTSVNLESIDTSRNIVFGSEGGNDSDDE
ncbi:uncharacterized protein FIBRA_01073 [Fibroporia radiculosa]|uniref:Uncharacterized protein n=1 Tax=Fibroporia radiculosa TaxID=599839 RepID=J4HSQ3_9APHY|nr:uncharacterized protein FIBRA_01073 [Fibroporia radiculosa]CCL99062.1 predicted protein [Fibroporia radiculosa]